MKTKYIIFRNQVKFQAVLIKMKGIWKILWKKQIDITQMVNAFFSLIN